MPQSYNTSSLLGPGSSSSGGSNSFSSLLGMPQPGALPTPSNTAGFGISKQPGGWGSTTASQQQNLGTDLGVSGYQNLLSAASALGLPMNYWGALLSGNPQALMQAQAPAVNSVLSQYDTARQNIANLQPRGGGTTSAMTQLPFQAAGNIASLLSNAQSNAAQGVTSAAGLLGSLGTSESGQASSNLSNIMNYILGQQQYGLQRQQSMEQLGMGIGSLLTAPLTGGLSGSILGSVLGMGASSAPSGFALGALSPTTVASIMGQMGP